MDLGVLEGQTSGGLFSNAIFDPSVIWAIVDPRQKKNMRNETDTRTNTLRRVGQKRDKRTNGQTHIGGWGKNVTNGRMNERTVKMGTHGRKVVF